MKIQLKTITKGIISHEINDTSNSSSTSSSITVWEFKQQIASKVDLEATQMRLVTSSGKVLAPDTAELDFFDLKDNDLIYVTRQLSSNNNTSSSPATNIPVSTVDKLKNSSSSSSKSTNANVAGGGFIPPELSSALDNPFVQSLLSNPEFLTTMFESNTGISKLMQDYPEIRQMISSPSFIRQMTETMRNPNMMREMLRNQDRQLSNIEALPGGFNHLSSIYRSLNDHDDEDSRPNHHVMNDNTPSEASRTLNTEALPNPWAASSPTSNSSNNSMGNNPNNFSFGSRPDASSLASLMQMFNARPLQQSQQQTQKPSSAPSSSTTQSNPAASQISFPFFPFPASLPNTNTSNAYDGTNPSNLNQQEMIERLTRQFSSGFFPFMPPMNNNDDSNTNTSPFSSANIGGNNNNNAYITAPNSMGVNNNGVNINPFLNSLPFLQSLSSNPSSVGTPIPSSTCADYTVLPNSTTRLSSSPSASMGYPSNSDSSKRDPPEVKYASQLITLYDMGFTDKQKCIRALLAAAGDVDEAVQYMLDKM